MPRLVLAVALSAAASAGVTAALLLPNASSAQGNRVVCAQVPQGVPARPNLVDDTFVANFMSEQLAAGREHFTTVQGLSTVLCAY